VAERSDSRKPQSEQIATFGNIKIGVTLKPLNPGRCRHTSVLSSTRLQDAQDLHCDAGLTVPRAAFMETDRPRVYIINYYVIYYF
jgi:hypothetical protein